MEYHNDYLKHSIQPSHIQEHNKLNRRGPQFHPLNEQNLGVSVLLKFIVSMFDPSFSFSNPRGLRCLKNVFRPPKNEISFRKIDVEHKSVFFFRQHFF